MSLRLLPRLLVSVTVTGVTGAGLAGCADATGEVQGGDPLFEADAGSTTADLPDVGMVTWTELYGSYFGPSAPSSCTAVANGCHMSIGDLGVQGSGYLCGATQDSCWMGITSSAIPSSFSAPVPTGGSAHPTTTILYKSLHPAGVQTAGQMPLSAADGGTGYEFTPLDLARIAAWIEQGAANN